MVYSKDRYQVNHGSREITHTRLLSNQLVGRICESELRDLLDQGDVEIFINGSHDWLELVAADLHEQMFLDAWRGHIAASDDFSLDDFAEGYCYVAEKWKGPEGKVIVLLYLHH